MYIIKNALKCISRAKGRNILIGVIVLVIAFSACVGLSIRQAAESARTEALSGMSITASISFDRQSMMSQLSEPGTEPSGEAPAGRGGFDKTQFADIMGSATVLSLEEYQTYATAESVQDFYYTLTASLDGGDGLEPVSTESESDTGSSGSQSMGGMNGKGAMRGFTSSGDFQLTGYSGESAMTSFLDGTCAITDGTVFEEGTAAYDCIISQELADYNALSTGDTITLANPANAEETYTLTVTGIYTDSSANEVSFTGKETSDPANRIYLSYTALRAILDASVASSVTVTDETTGNETETEMTGTLSATYVFADSDAYSRFEVEARALGLDESYSISSADLTAFENSLTPLNTLSKMAGWFLLVILIIGAVILIVLNIFNVRERKYEIGVLTAIGMKKGKVALQFLTESFVVTLAAVIVGALAGAICAVPVTNALLENQVASQQTQNAQIEQNFGRGGNMNAGGAPTQMSGGKGMGIPNLFGGSPETNYVTEISSAMNLTVALQMLGVAILLTLAAGAVSMLFVMRYEPLKILANRD